MATKTKTSKKLVFENFRTLEQLIDTMETRELNPAFKSLGNGRIASQSDESKDRSPWSGSATYTEAMETLRNGYKDPLDKMKKAILKVGELDNHKRPRLENDFVGFIPHVPNTVMNLPQTMLNRQRQPKKAKTMHLTYGFCALADVTPAQLIKGGINFISLVNSLEKQGYRVKIDVLFSTVTSKTATVFTCNVKEYGQNLNLLKLAFPLVHPSMLRRIAFKWLETVPNLTDKDFIHGYGKTLVSTMSYDGKRERAFLESHNILKGENVYYCNAYQAFQSQDQNELAHKMGLIK